jgi:RHS repeat-associated protein
VDFSVIVGPNAGASGSATTDGNGQASFTYQSNGMAGTDQIQAQAAQNSCTPTATKTWQEASPRVDNRFIQFNLQIDPALNCGCPDGAHTSFTAERCAGGGVYLGTKEDTGLASVYLHNGEFFLQEVDLEIPGRGFNWKFERSYRSGIIFNGPLGQNWEFNYNRRLFVMPGGAVLRMDGFARTDAYTPNGDGRYTAPAGFYTSLVMNADGTFTEREPDGTKIQYSMPDARSVAVMTRLVDRNGNTMRFISNGQNQLIRVIDTLGRPIDYAYNDQGRLTEVRDFFGRSIRFQYDANGDLIAVISPAVTGTPTHNDFPQGQTTRYSYSSGFPQDVLNHNLLTITAPNEVASQGQPKIRIEYDTTPNSPNLDRVLRQMIGGTNAPAALMNGQLQFRRDVRVPAGGTISYEYKFLGLTPPNDFVSPVTQTTVTDRNGNRTEYQFNQLGNIARIREFTNRHLRPGDPEFFETRYEYNKDGELTRMIDPEGNAVEYAYDERNASRFQQGNLLSETRKPDSRRGGDQAFIQSVRTYEPIYNQVRTVTEARGNDPAYLPQNGGATSAERYTTRYIFDYQEGSNFAALARELGVSESEVRRRLQGIPMDQGDVNGDGRTDQIAGNVVKVTRPAVNLLSDSHMAQIEGSARQPIEETAVYNRFGQTTKRRDAEGNVTLYTYYPENDPDGDGQNLTPGVSADPVGYLREEIRDAESSTERNSRTDPTPAEIHHRYVYDRVGNVIKEIDGRGIATQYVVNQLNQIVRISRAADVGDALRNSEEPNYGGCTDPALVECRAGLIAFRYFINVFYDFNNNVIRREVENRDSNNPALAGPVVEFTLAYDILNNLIEETQEVSESPREVLVTRYRYDRNENRVLVISPAAVAGRQPSNVTSAVFDERDLLLTSTRGGVTDQFRSLTAHADIPERTQIPNSRDLSTFTRVYDLNRNLKQFVDGADNNGDGQPEATTYLYDGFDRRVSIIDAAGNQSFINYDPAGNVVRVSQFGPVGGPTPTSNQAATLAQPLTLQSFRQPLLSREEFKYDELSRLWQRDDRLVDYRDQGVAYVRSPQLTDGPLGAANDGMVVTRYEYDRKSRRIFVIEDDLSTVATFYDGVDRAIRQIDPEENEVLTTYDDDNNAVKIEQVEITQRNDVDAGKAPDLTETFTTIRVYDSLNRLIRTTDNLGQTTRYQYDSRNNLILRSDAQGPLIPDSLGLFAGTINANGNTTSDLYDGINRPIAEVMDLRVNGQGSRPIDTSNPANPDGQITLRTSWDANSRMTTQTDDNGNTTSYQYDDLNRRLRETFADNTTNQYFYDADDNLIRTVDENGSAIAAQYDGINRRTGLAITPARDVIGTTQQVFQYDGLSRLTRAVDNNEPGDAGDDAVVTAAYDSLSRRLEEVQNGRAVSSRWAGDNNRLGLVYPNGRELGISFDSLDRINQISNQRSAISGQQPIADYDYIGPNRVLERTYSNGTRLTYLNDARTQDIGYDGLERIINRRHLHPDNSLAAGFSYGYDRANNKLFEQPLHEPRTRESYTFDSLYRLTRFAREGSQPDAFQLDGAGNWVNRNGAGNRVNNMNEYEQVAGVAQRYDANGNLIEDSVNRYEYDAFNRLRRVTRKSGNAVVAVYRYDAFNRRISRAVTNSGALNEQVQYFYDGWREIEERRDGSTQQYVYGGWIDEPLTLDQDTNNDGVIDRTLFYYENARLYITALTDETGAVIERYAYDAYGKPTITDAGGAPRQRSAVNNPYLFTARRLDPETGFYYYRMRHLNPATGRFLQRDPIGTWTDRANGGNAYTYVGNNPVNQLDAMGLQPGIDIFGGPPSGGHVEAACAGGEKPLMMELTCEDRCARKVAKWYDEHCASGWSCGVMRVAAFLKCVDENCARKGVTSTGVSPSAALAGGTGHLGQYPASWYEQEEDEPRGVSSGVSPSAALAGLCIAPPCGSAMSSVSLTPGAALRVREAALSIGLLTPNPGGAQSGGGIWRPGAALGMYDAFLKPGAALGMYDAFLNPGAALGMYDAFLKPGAALGMYDAFLKPGAALGYQTGGSSLRVREAALRSGASGPPGLGAAQGCCTGHH